MWGNLRGRVLTVPAGSAMIAFVMDQPLAQQDDLTEVCWFLQFWRDSVIYQCIDSVMYQWVEVTVLLKQSLLQIPH